VTGVAGAQLLVGPVTALAVAAGVSARTRSRPAGIRSGLLVGALSAPMRFRLRSHRRCSAHANYTLTDKYDIAASRTAATPPWPATC